MPHTPHIPHVPHIEQHFTGSETVRDIVIGMADGLTVHFALAAGLSAAVTSTDIVVTAGMAEIVAGAIAMGLGGFLAARTDQEHYSSEEKREYWEVDHLRHREIEETEDVFKAYGLTGDTLKSVVDAIAADKKRWVDFMMKFELGLEKPDPKRAPISAGTISGSYLAGGLIPLAPYMMYDTIPQALPLSVAMTGVALAVFGAVKGKFTGISILKSAVQTLLVGGLAAGAAYYLASLFG
jgi:VIT1/CCC1 family predicted Fe2+/Mn2+ transporter